MTREIPNREYISLKIKLAHSPVIVDIGDQRDPQEVIICKCAKTYPLSKDILAATYSYFEHVLDLLEEEGFLETDFLESLP